MTSKKSRIEFDRSSLTDFVGALSQQKTATEMIAVLENPSWLLDKPDRGWISVHHALVRLERRDDDENDLQDRHDPQQRHDHKYSQSKSHDAKGNSNGAVKGQTELKV